MNRDDTLFAVFDRHYLARFRWVKTPQLVSGTTWP
jgi:hypothetical protein